MAQTLRAVRAAWLATIGVLAAASAPAAERFDEARARARLGELMAEGVPHPIGSDANRRVRERIVGQLAAMGYTPEVQREFVCSDFRRSCGTVENVLARLQGRRRDEVVLLNSHYDTQPATPGAGDPMAGVATLLEVARILRSEPPAERGVLLLVNDGEEAGLLGATAFVDRHRWAPEVKAVVNLEARGSRGASRLGMTVGGNIPVSRVVIHQGQ